MITQDKILYESTQVWEQALQTGQKNLAQAIIDFFPAGVTTALDVGCGDGKLTATIIEATKCPVIGLDFSQEALSRCTFETILGDASNLPVQDEAFDLVLTTDMLEHLSEPIEKKVWDQLFRAAKNWVMVAVPFREDLREATAKCHRCKQYYHVNWHMRSYDWHELVSRCPDTYEIDKIILTGESWSPYHVLETKFRREILNEWAGWTEAFCPHCGESGTKPDTIKPLSSLSAAALGNIIYASRLNSMDYRNHSEILVIYRRKCLVQMRKHQFIKADQLDVKLNEIILNETKIENNLIPYPSIVRIVDAIDEGFILQFPVYSSQDFLEIKSTQSPLEIELLVEDGMGVLFNDMISIAADNVYKIEFSRKIIASYYGVLVRIKSIKAIKSMQLGENKWMGVLQTKNVPYAYHEAQWEKNLFYIQVTSSCFYNDTLLKKSNDEQINWAVLFEKIELLFQNEKNTVEVFNKNLVQERNRLEASNQNLILERSTLENANQIQALEIEQLKAENYQLQSEVYAFNNRFEVRVMNKVIGLIHWILNKTKRIFRQ